MLFALRTFALGALGLSLAAQDPDFRASDWYIAGDFNLVGNVTPYGAQGDTSTRGKVGSGVELMVGWRMPGALDFRLMTGYEGTRIRNLPWLDDPQEDTVAEFARNWRVGAEVVVHPWGRRMRTPYLFIGGGVRETWVGRAAGSFAGMGVAAIFSSITGLEAHYSYDLKANALDTWSGYATAGLGWRLSPGSFLELRFVAGSHTEFAIDGLTTLGYGPEVRRNDTSVHVAIGLRGR